jgi:GNAT superfamily N-acetyltransferase
MSSLPAEPTSSLPAPVPARPPPRAVRIGPDLRQAAAERLVGPGAGPRATAAHRFIATADQLGIDLSLLWGVLDPTGRAVLQACLAVVGSGRTAMIFISAGGEGIRRPIRSGSAVAGTIGDVDAAGGAEAANDRGTDRSTQERVAAITAACEHLRRLRRVPGSADPRAVVLAQALLEPDEHEAIQALVLAGFTRLGDLAYMRRPMPRSGGGFPRSWPSGTRVVRVADLAGHSGAEMLERALARTYEHTLDCPELCGLREPADVLESHRCVGQFDPRFWWLVLRGEQPEGCMLFNPCREQQLVELVYLGLSAELRGRGLGSMLLSMGLAELGGRPERRITCAVDTRNQPALRLYRRAGFEQFATRVPMVLPLSARG